MFILIKKSKYKNMIESYDKRIEQMQNEIEKLKSMLPRKQQLNACAYHQLVRFAKKEYGISPEMWMDKDDLIHEIMSVEKALPLPSRV